MAFQGRRSCKTTFLSLFTIATVLLSCAESSSGSGEISGDPSHVEKLYQTRCALCHGENGKLMLAGATDLSKSQLSLEERIQVISNGRNTMTPFKDILSGEDIEALAEYIGSLRQ